MNTKFYKGYQNCILVICIITILLFGFWAILNSLTEVGHTTDTIQNLMGISNSILKINLLLLCFACVTHIMVLLTISFKGKNSFLGLVIQQALPLVLPTLLAFVITSIQQKDDAVLKDLLTGIASGVISSIIILMLDRNHTLAVKVMKYLIPEYLEHTKLDTQVSSEKPVRPKKRGVPYKKPQRQNE